ncbi:hypothetical protein [Pseudalkalibacillus sp. SCS-8]|uniref:hypothetical protein n=1 Tax=Pseudalkalibacillus nanhaiensis TaxID=3115291 RepID=UPI0032DA019F
MKTIMSVIMTVTLLVSGFAVHSYAESTSELPKGDFYNLKLIGVPKDKKAPMKNNDGTRIFVPLYGESNIWLREGDFQVLDANGTDEDDAEFQLPNPDPNNDGTTEYTVYVRALGKPGGEATMNTCGTDADTGETYCSDQKLVVTRTAGQSPWTNASGELFYIYTDTDGDGEPERYNLFNDQFEDYYWEYDNNGLKVAQLRFYRGVSTQVQ